MDVLKCLEIGKNFLEMTINLKDLNLDEFQKALTHFFSELGIRHIKINKKYSKLGYQCRLPSIEEYRQLGKDMGFDSSKGYTPQVFSDLAHEFWSSASFSDFAYAFYGSYGFISIDYSKNSLSARCVCGH
ncbi:MAG: hypothetical protein HQK51_07985 [Oligoflexia bacterium]|nr:hypothetical protein [Oligoflexia bacterium]